MKQSMVAHRDENPTRKAKTCRHIAHATNESLVVTKPAFSVTNHGIDFSLVSFQRLFKIS
jgi:hypothetical protein